MTLQQAAYAQRKLQSLHRSFDVVIVTIEETGQYDVIIVGFADYKIL